MNNLESANVLVLILKSIKVKNDSLKTSVIKNYQLEILGNKQTKTEVIYSSF